MMDKTAKIAESLVKQLEETLAENIKDHIAKMIDKVVETRFESLTKKVDSLQRSIDLLQSDLDEDRKGIQQMRIATDHVESEVREMRAALNKQSKTLQNKIAGATTEAVVEAVPQAVSDTFEIVSKKVKVEKKPFWKRLVRR